MYPGLKYWLYFPFRAQVYIFFIMLHILVLLCFINFSMLLFSLSSSLPFSCLPPGGHEPERGEAAASKREGHHDQARDGLSVPPHIQSCEYQNKLHRILTLTCQTDLH